MRFHWDPFCEIHSLHREVDRLLGSLGFDRMLPHRWAHSYPQLNVSEDDEGIYVEALLPGVDPESLDLSVQRDELTIAGEKKRAGEPPDEAYHKSERWNGTFTRTIRLPTEVDETKVQAEYADGILRITLPKAEQAKPRQITVKRGK